MKRSIAPKPPSEGFSDFLQVDRGLKPCDQCPDVLAEFEQDSWHVLVVDRRLLVGEGDA
jgi:cytidine deaminase